MRYRNRFFFIALRDFGSAGWNQVVAGVRAAHILLDGIAKVTGHRALRKIAEARIA
jgi:hypothetical protein